MYSTERMPNPSPNQQINIFGGGGWDDCEDGDEDEDYVDMAPVKPQGKRTTHSQTTSPYYDGSTKQNKTPDRLTALKHGTPDVIVLPASPHGSRASSISVRTSPPLSNVQLTDESSDKSDSESGSESDYVDEPFRSIKDGDNEQKTRSSSRTSIPSSELAISSPPPLPQRSQTSAGQAARKYLQLHQVSRSSPRSPTGESPKSPTGLQRSSSRVGTRGVQNRINRSRPHMSMMARKYRSTDELDSAVGERSTDNPKINEAKLKSRTLDRSLSGVKISTGDQNNDTSNDDPMLIEADKRKSKDGAAVMNLISDRRRKSQSLDSKYLEYLDGISKHASAPNSPKTTLDKKEKKKKLSSKKSKRKEEDQPLDDEEEFQKYAQAMSSRTKRSSCTASAPDLSVTCEDSVGQNLADFVKERGKSQKLKKKQLSSGFSGKFSFRKSKTSTKLVGEPAESTQEIEIEEIEMQQEKTNSWSKSKRKSWRKKHGFSIKTRSKERINSDSCTPPSSPPLVMDESSMEMKGGFTKRTITKGTPQIKQTLGYDVSDSANLRIRNHINDTQRHRSTSVNQDDSQPHSPILVRPPLGKSMTLDNRRSSKDVYQSNGTTQMPFSKLQHTTSWNSENSGSNSDLSVVLDDDLDDTKVSRAGTLSRLLGRKMKSGKFDGMDYDDNEPNYGSLGRRRTKRGKYATLGSPAMALRMKHSTSREALLAATEPVNLIDLFLQSKKFMRGFRVNSDGDNDESEEEGAELNEVGLTFESAGVNKYATITGGKAASYWNYDTKSLKKRESDNSIELGRPGSRAISGIQKRNKSLPSTDSVSKGKLSKGKGISAAFTRSLQRSASASPSNHLPDVEIPCGNEFSVGHFNSPIRARRFQKIEPLLEETSEKILVAATTLYRCLIGTRPDLLQTHYADEERDDPYDTDLPEGDVTPSYKSSIFGRELVNWLVEQIPSSSQEITEATSSEKRRSACGMLQALLEEGALSHVRREHHFQDSYLLYQFHQAVTRLDQNGTKNERSRYTESAVSSSTGSFDEQSTTSAETNEQNEDNSGRSSRASSTQSSQTVTSDSWVPPIVDEQELKEILAILQNHAPDALFRMILRKLPEDRTAEELMMIYEEILHIKALSHLSDSVKRELAGVLKFEFHRKAGKTLFNQGDEGRSWYIIIKGSVHVDVQGQGVVCTLRDGDDFGNLAIINDAPRAATIVLAEDNCQLLRVDKHDFVRILKDVEANTVRLKEHEKDVLILQKIHARSSSTSGRREKSLENIVRAGQKISAAATPTRNHHRYAISAGTPSKIVEHIIKSLKPWSTAKQSDEAMEDLILMYQVFMSTQDISKYLMNLYHSEKAEQIDVSKSIKRKVVYFVVRWSHIATHIFYDQPAIGPFLKELKQAVQDDEKIYPKLKEDLARIFVPESSSNESPTHRGWITVESPAVQRYPQIDSRQNPHQAIKATDDIMLKVYNVNGTYTTVKLPIISMVSEILSFVAEKQGRDAADLHLIQVQSDGDMYALPKTMTSAATSLGVNSRLFICSSEEKDEISPLDEQRVIPSSNGTVLEIVGSQEIAEHITQLDWELINSIHVMEFVHKVFGSHKFNGVTSNIDIFARRFNQLAYWAPSEICVCANINKRVHLLRKFIKIAQHLKELQNMNAFMAVMIGLGNQALSRLHATWDKLPTKYKKLMTEFEAILDPSRNHRAYRLHVASLRSPMIPYLPLLMKDMTFQHEGNDSTRNGLINFEKMHMMSNSIRGVIQACCKPFEMNHAIIASKTYEETRNYTRNFDVITDQKLLNKLSGKAEARR